MWAQEEVVYLEEDDMAAFSVRQANDQTVKAAVTTAGAKGAKRLRSVSRKATTLQDGVALEAFHYQGGEEDGGFDDADDPSYDNITTATSSSASSLGAAGGLGIDAVSPQPGRRIFRLPSVTSRDANALMTTNNREVEDFDDYGDATFNKSDVSAGSSGEQRKAQTPYNRNTDQSISSNAGRNVFVTPAPNSRKTSSSSSTTATTSTSTSARQSQQHRPQYMTQQQHQQHKQQQQQDDYNDYSGYPAHWRASTATSSQTAPGPRRAVPMVPPSDRNRRRESLPATTTSYSSKTRATSGMTVSVLKPKPVSINIINNGSSSSSSSSSASASLPIDAISFRPSWVQARPLMTATNSSSTSTSKVARVEEIEVVADDEMGFNASNASTNNNSSTGTRSFAAGFVQPLSSSSSSILPADDESTISAAYNSSHYQQYPHQGHYDDFDDMGHQDYHQHQHNSTNAGSSPGHRLSHPPSRSSSHRSRRAGHFASMLHRATQHAEGNRTRWGHIRRENMRSSLGRVPEARDLSDPRCSSKSSLDCSIIGAVSNEYLMATFGVDLIVVQILSLNARAEGSLKHIPIEDQDAPPNAMDVSNNGACSSSNSSIEMRGSVAVLFADSDVVKQLSDMSGGGRISAGCAIRVYDYQLLPPRYHQAGSLENVWRSVIANPTADYCYDELLRHSMRVLCAGIVEILPNRVVGSN